MAPGTVLTPAQIAARYGNRARPAPVASATPAAAAPPGPVKYEAVAQMMPDGPPKLGRRSPEEEAFERSLLGSRGAGAQASAERDPEAELQEYKAAAFAEVRKRREAMERARLGK